MIRLLRSIATAIAVVVILFEEWLWEPLKRLMLAVSRLPVIRQLAAFIGRLPPFAALILYLVPVVVLLPFKIAGLWLIGQGHSLLGISTFLGAKVVGTALLAWLFSLTKPALMQISWFARAYGWVTELSAAAHAWLHRQPIYQVAKRELGRFRDRVKRLSGKQSSPSEYPLLEHFEEGRLREKLVAEHYLRMQGDTESTVSLGNDQIGVPDCFAFKNEKLQCAIEVTGYLLGDIHDIRRVTQVAPSTFKIDIRQSTEVHRRQPHPRTLVQKKIFGGRKYRRYDAEKLVLLIHSDVLVRDSRLCFAMLGPMHMSPSCDNFSHHRAEIIEDLQSLIASRSTYQWDEIWLIDYTQFVVPDKAVFHRLWPNADG